MMPSYELLTSSCKGHIDCAKIVRRPAGVLTVVGTAVTDPTEMSALGVGGGEGAVDITEQLLREAYAALVKGSS